MWRRAAPLASRPARAPSVPRGRPDRAAAASAPAAHSSGRWPGACVQPVSGMTQGGAIAVVQADRGRVEVDQHGAGPRARTRSSSGGSLTHRRSWRARALRSVAAEHHVDRHGQHCGRVAAPARDRHATCPSGLTSTAQSGSKPAWVLILPVLQLVADDDADDPRCLQAGSRVSPCRPLGRGEQDEVAPADRVSICAARPLHSQTWGARLPGPAEGTYSVTGSSVRLGSPVRITAADRRRAEDQALLVEELPRGSTASSASRCAPSTARSAGLTG